MWLLGPRHEPGSCNMDADRPTDRGAGGADVADGAGGGGGDGNIDSDRDRDSDSDSESDSVEKAEEKAARKAERQAEEKRATPGGRRRAEEEAQRQQYLTQLFGVLPSELRRYLTVSRAAHLAIADSAAAAGQAGQAEGIMLLQNIPVLLDSAGGFVVPRPPPCDSGFAMALWIRLESVVPEQTHVLWQQGNWTQQDGAAVRACSGR